ncbi:MAG TPA: hypothetical protein P5274_02740 [Candidatus Paceibacterota bacterium]|nr:hypothetical protein [Candidatus Paceibacterota bacterium]
MNIYSPWFVVLMFLPLSIVVGSRLFFFLKDRWKISRKVVLRRETLEYQKKMLTKLLESYRQGDKRACLLDKEIISWFSGDYPEGVILLDFLRDEEVDFMSFCNWLDESVGRATVRKAIELLSNPEVITRPDEVDSYLGEIHSVCETFNFQLSGEFGITEIELDDLAIMKILAWRDCKFKTYEERLQTLNNSWQKVVDVLNARKPPIHIPPSALASKSFCPQFPSQEENK